MRPLTDPGVWTRLAYAWPANAPNLYRAIDSTGDTIDFLLSPNGDLIAAKGFLQLALSAGRPDRASSMSTAILLTRPQSGS
jgi:hypothetical protein